LALLKKTPFLTAGVVGLGAGLMGQEEQQQLAYEEPIYKREPVSLEGGEQVAALTPEEYEQLYTQGGERKSRLLLYNLHIDMYPNLLTHHMVD
jgi:hypothetical protein